MGDLILYFFLLVLGILLSLNLDTCHKQGKFSETLLKKSLKFVINTMDSTIVFNLGLVLLPAEVNSSPEKQGCKRDAFVDYGNSRIEMIFALLTKVIALYIQVFIV